MKAETLRRATSRVTLLGKSKKVLKKRIDGKLKACQSSDEPLRTTRALVKAANIIVMANSTTQIAVEEGGGEYFWATPRSPPGGVFQPPIPERFRSGSRLGPICGGS